MRGWVDRTGLYEAGLLLILWVEVNYYVPALKYIYIHDLLERMAMELA